MIKKVKKGIKSEDCFETFYGIKLQFMRYGKNEDIINYTCNKCKEKSQGIT